jgi:GNAT superfamily N-acetyltransferase
VLSTADAAVRTLSGRPWRDLGDLRRMQELLRRGRRSSPSTTAWHPGDLEWWIGQDDPTIDWSERITLWSDDATGTVVAWTWVTPPDELDWFVDPAADDATLRRWLLERQAPRPRTVWATDHDERVTGVLRDAGYEPADGGYIHFGRTLDADEPLAAAPPAGFGVRSVDPRHDGEERLRVHRAAFAPSRMTAEKVRIVTEMPSYRADLDVVAEAPDGSLAAFCLGWFDEATHTVELEPVGTDPAHARRGLATAVVIEALRRARDLGARHAFVTAGASGSAPQALYGSLGFAEALRSVPFRQGAGR